MVAAGGDCTFKESSSYTFSEVSGLKSALEDKLYKTRWSASGISTFTSSMTEDIETCDISAELRDFSDSGIGLYSIEADAGITGTDKTGHEARAPPRTFSEAEASASQGS